MSKTVTIEVTQEDIDKGEPEDCNNCAIACAIKRQMGAHYAKVDVLGIYWVNGGTHRASELPQEAWDFIDAFDAFDDYTEEYSKAVAPMSFTVEVEEVR